MQQMVPQTARKQSEGADSDKMRALSATEEDTNDVWNRRLSNKVLCLIGEDGTDSTEMASEGRPGC